MNVSIAAQTISSSVADAIDNWIKAFELSYIRSRRFSFDIFAQMDKKPFAYVSEEPTAGIH